MYSYEAVLYITGGRAVYTVRESVRREGLAATADISRRLRLRRYWQLRASLIAILRCTHAQRGGGLFCVQTP